MSSSTRQPVLPAAAQCYPTVVGTPALSLTCRGALVILTLPTPALQDSIAAWLFIDLMPLTTQRAWNQPLPPEVRTCRSWPARLRACCLPAASDANASACHVHHPLTACTTRRGRRISLRHRAPHDDGQHRLHGLEHDSLAKFSLQPALHLRPLSRPAPSLTGTSRARLKWARSERARAQRAWPVRIWTARARTTRARTARARTARARTA